MAPEPSPLRAGQGKPRTLWWATAYVGLTLAHAAQLLAVAALSGVPALPDDWKRRR